MKKILTIFLFFISYIVFSQNLIINEVLPSNAGHDTLLDGSSPDWVELYNSSNASINLKGFSLRDDLVASSSSFTFPDISIAPGAYLLVYANGEPEVSTTPEPKVAYWETIVRQGDVWRYAVPSAQPSSIWTSIAFNDAAWKTGATSIGYNKSNTYTTKVPTGTTSVYMRKTFTLPDASLVLPEAFLHVDYDDGFVAYLNGIEIARSGLSNTPPAFDDFANLHNPVMESGGSPEAFTIKDISKILQTGNNVLAIEVHNTSATSSDLLMIPFLSLGFQQSQNWFRGTSPELGLTAATPSNKNALMAAFKIDADNDTVFLFNPSGALIDKMIVEDMPTNVSQGRLNGIVEENYWFIAPTPAAANVSQTYSTRLLAKPMFSLPAGIITGTKKVAITSKDADVAIYYTTDGSQPSENNGTYYTDSIQISQSTSLRAIATRPNCIQSETRTHSYLLLKRKITLPIVSISVNPSDFFDEQTGIYVLGPNAAEIEPHYGANYWQDWEKKVHLELFEPNGMEAASVDAGVKIAGNWSRMNPQKSLKFHFRKQYGDSKLSYRIFKDKPIDAFGRLLLRNSGGDYNTTQMRDGFISALVRNMNIDRQAYRPAMVFINGQYWGVENLREKISADYLQENYGAAKDSITLLESNAVPVEGTNAQCLQLFDFINTNSLTDSANYAQIEKQIDIPNYINYVNTEIYVVNEDWPGNNIRFWRTTHGKWRWILFDTDFGFGIWDESKSTRQMLAFATATDGPDWPNPSWSTALLRNLLTNQNFKQQFMNSMADRLNTTFLADSVHLLIDSLQKNIATEMPYHCDRWNYDMESWRYQVDVMRNFATERAQYVWQEYQSYFSISGLFNLQLNLSSPAAGSIALNSIVLNKFPWSGSYFNAIPITLKALPKPGYRFVHWEGASTATTAQITITTDQLCKLTAVFEYTAANVPMLVINEIMYNPNNKSGDWIELYNKGTQTIDLSGWSIKNEKPYTSFIIPQGTQLKANQYLLICKDSLAFKAAYNLSAKGNLGFDLAEDRDVISLFDANKNLIDQLSYTDRSPWPRKCDGLGYSLELQTNSSKISDKWKSYTLGGTPGAINAAAQTSINKQVVICEIMYKAATSGQSGDWFEITNTSNEAIDLSQWLVADKAGNKSLIPNNTTLAAGASLVLANDLMAFAQVYPTVQNVIACSLSLSSDKEQLLLFDRSEALIDSVSFSSHAPWPDEANGHGFSLVLRNPLLNNALPSSWTTDVVFGTPGTSQLVSQPESLNSDLFQVYPNPASQSIRIVARIGSQLQICNATGIVLYSFEATNSVTTIDISGLPAGIYAIIQDNENKQQTQRFIKEL